jgi:hypothetical protein
MQKHPARGPMLRASLLSCVLGFGTCGDLGRVRPFFITDDMHAWIGAEAARSHGEPVSLYPLTDDERLLRDLAYPLIEPPYDRQRWYSVLGEYGISRVFHRDWWYFDPTAYGARLNWEPFRSATGRYQQLIEDVRNDVTRIDPFFTAARRVLDMDRKREKSLAYVTDLTEAELVNARARIVENILIVGWVHRSLTERCAAYRFALERLVIATPSPLAVEAERALTLMKVRIAQNRLVPPPPIGPVIADGRKSVIVVKD